MDLKIYMKVFSIISIITNPVAIPTFPALFRRSVSFWGGKQLNYLKLWIEVLNCIFFVYHVYYYYHSKNDGE